MKLKSWCILLLVAFIIKLPEVHGASGCNYPTSLDSYTNKVTGDYLTVADINSRSCAIEKLEAGPLQPNLGTLAAPAYSFRNDTDTGMYSGAANRIDFSTGNSRALSLFGARIFGGTTTTVTTGSLAGDSVLANTNAYRFMNAAVTTSANYGLESVAGDNLLVRVPGGTNKIQFWAAGFKMFEMGALGDGSGSGLSFTEASTGPTPAANVAGLYARDNGSGKTQLCVQFGSGAAQCFATEP